MKWIWGIGSWERERIVWGGRLACFLFLVLELAKRRPTRREGEKIISVEASFRRSPHGPGARRLDVPRPFVCNRQGEWRVRVAFTRKTDVKARE